MHFYWSQTIDHWPLQYNVTFIVFKLLAQNGWECAYKVEVIQKTNNKSTVRENVRQK